MGWGVKGLSDRIKSFTSAGVFPVKVLQDKQCVGRDKKIKPRHIQLMLTNKCNLTCDFCSCAGRDKGKEMELASAYNIVSSYRDLGCSSVTITGGGEPLLYKHINELILFTYGLGIKIGLVTNGLCLNRLSQTSLECIDWIRISFDDKRDWGELKDVLLTVRKSTVDWSFSYVISKTPNFVNIKNVIEFATMFGFTHVRLVSDLLDIENAPNMYSIKNQICDMGVDDFLVIYQGRKEFVRGRERCLISLLKPVIDVDGFLYPCCGAQYAEEEPAYRYSATMRMGHVGNMEEIFDRQKHYNGGDCVRCYYDDYNTLLEHMTEDIQHGEFL